MGRRRGSGKRAKTTTTSTATKADKQPTNGGGEKDITSDTLEHDGALLKNDQEEDEEEEEEVDDDEDNCHDNREGYQDNAIQNTAKTASATTIATTITTTAGNQKKKNHRRNKRKRRSGAKGGEGGEGGGRPRASTRVFHDWFSMRASVTPNKKDMDDPTALYLRQCRVDDLYRDLCLIKDQLKPTAAAAVAVTSNDKDNDEGKTKKKKGNWKDETDDEAQRVQKLLEEARSRCNPLDCVGRKPPRSFPKNKRNKGLNVYFLNRSALKLINMDAHFQFSLIQPVLARCTFSYVDLCGAPGGFSEAILAKLLAATADDIQHKDMMSRGYGMSLGGSNQDGAGTVWRLEQSPVVGPYLLQDGEEVPMSASLGYADIFRTVNTTLVMPSKKAAAKVNNDKHQHCFRICWGQDGTGDIYNWNNIVSLRETIQQDQLCKDESQRKTDAEVVAVGKPEKPLEQDESMNDPKEETTNVAVPTSSAPSPSETFRGVDLVVADGGFDAQRDCNTQEEVSFQLVVCQMAAALTVIRPGGTVLLKVLGCRRWATRRVLSQCAARFFDQGLDVYKPVVSRPASSERYIVFTSATTKTCMPLSLKEARAWRDECLARVEEWNQEEAKQHEAHRRQQDDNASTAQSSTVANMATQISSATTVQGDLSSSDATAMDDGGDETEEGKKDDDDKKSNPSDSAATDSTPVSTVTADEKEMDRRLLAAEEAILELNTAACQDLLSYLQQQPQGEKEMNEENTPSCWWPHLKAQLSPQFAAPSVHAYRQAWRLSS